MQRERGGSGREGGVGGGGVGVGDRDMQTERVREEDGKRGGREKQRHAERGGETETCRERE